MPEPKASGEKTGEGLVMAENAPGGGHTRKIEPENQPIEFRTENIGQWAARQEGLFAEQNRKDAEAKAKREKKLKQARIGVIVGCAVLVVLAVVSAVVVAIVAINSAKEEIPIIAGSTSEDVNDYREALQVFFDKSDEKVSAVEDIVQETLKTDNGKEYADQVRLAQLMLYMNQGLYQEALGVSGNVNPDRLDQKSKVIFYSMLYNMYIALGDSEKANEYSSLAYEAGSKLEDANGGY